MNEIILKLKRWHIAFLSCLASSILAHGFLISNCFYMNSDDASYVLNGSSIIVALGRYIGRMIENYIDLYGFSMVIKPFNLMIYVFVICIVCALLIEIFDIKDIKYVILFSLLFPLQPCYIDILGYNFVCHFDAYAELLMIFSIYLMIKKNNFILPVFLIVVSLGIYQAYIAMACALMVIYIFIQLFIGVDIKNVFKLSLKILVVFVVGLLIYVIGNRIALNYYNIELWRGWGFGKNVIPSDIGGYVDRILTAYKHFFLIFFERYGFLAEFKIFGTFLFIFFVLCHSFIFINVIKQKKWNKLILLIILLLIEPILFDLHYVLFNNLEPRVQTSLYFIVLLPIILVDITQCEKIKVWNVYKMVINGFAILLVWCFIFLSVGEHYNLYVVNKDYERMFNYIANKIYNHPDYTEDIDIVVMGQYKDIKNQSTMRDNKHFLIHADNYPKLNTISATYAVVQHYRKEASLRVDYLLEPKEYEKYKDMPCFPNDGCIKKISDKALLIKLGEK